MQKTETRGAQWSES